MYGSLLKCYFYVFDVLNLENVFTNVIERNKALACKYDHGVGSAAVHLTRTLAA